METLKTCVFCKSSCNLQLQSDSSYPICIFCLPTTRPAENVELSNSLPLQSEMVSETFFECAICAKKFCSKKAITRHLCNVHSEKTEICPVCGKKMSAMRLLRHRSTHSRKFECSKCPERFANGQRLIDHQNLVHSFGFYKCLFCDFNCKSRPKLLKHVKEAHGENISKKILCFQCGKILLTDNAFEMHLKYCGKKKEIKKVHRNYERPSAKYFCDVCCRKFVVKERYLEHMEIHQMEERKFSCEKCAKKYPSLNALKTHFVAVHQKGVVVERPRRQRKKNPKEFKCDTCNRLFTRRCRLEHHEKVEHQNFRYICKICERSYRLVDNFLSHLRKSHDCGSDEEIDSQFKQIEEINEEVIGLVEDLNGEIDVQQIYLI